MKKAYINLDITTEFLYKKSKKSGRGDYHNIQIDITRNNLGGENHVC